MVRYGGAETVKTLVLSDPRESVQNEESVLLINKLISIKGRREARDDKLRARGGRRKEQW